MSGHADEEDTEDAQADRAEAARAQADDGHAFDAQPATSLSEGEPETPLWLPAVGLAFFVAVGLFMLTGDEEPGAGEPTTTAKTAAAVAPPARPARPAAPTPATPPRPRPALMPAPPGSGPPKVRTELTPETIERLRKRIEAQRASK
jgi:hypothetical protein